MEINSDQRPAETCFQQIRSSKPVRATVDLFERHPSISFTLTNIILGTQVIAAGTCAFRATQIYNDPAKNFAGNSEIEAVFMICVTTALFLAASMGSFFKFKHTPSVFLVFSAVCLGTVMASKQQFNRATVQWNNISQTNTKIGYENEGLKVEFSKDINECFDFIAENQKIFTLPDCYICDVPGVVTERISSIPFYASEILQTRVVHFNQTLCPPSSGIASIYWDDFTSITFNETAGPWPCDSEWPSHTSDERAVVGTATVLDAMVGILPPFSVLVEPIFNNNQGCVTAVGFGVRSFDLQLLCGMSYEKFSQFPSEWLTCFSAAGMAFAVNYTKNFQGLPSLPSVSFPKPLDSLVQGDKSKIPYLLMGYLGIVALGLLSYRQWVKNKRRPEQQPLLQQAPAAV